MNVRLVASVCVGSFWVCAAALGQGAPSPVHVAEVVVERVGERRMVTGELRSRRVAEVASQEEGAVVEVAVEAGARVKAGQLLARIDAERLELDRERTLAERAAAEEAVAEEEAAVIRWQSELDSLETATARGASNARERREVDYELSQAKARFARTQADLIVFDSRLALLERRLRDMRIVAPFAGTVTQKLTEDGEWLSAGDSVCVLVQTDELEVVLDVPQRYLSSLAVRAREAGAAGLSGDDLVVESDALSGRIGVTNVRIVPQIDQRARTFRVLGVAGNESGTLAAGQSVIGWVPTGVVGEHTIVPTDAVLRNEMGTIVYVSRPQQDGPAQAMPMNVSVLFELPGRVVVAGGLRAGDQVVVEGKERLFPTAPIVPMPVASSGAPGGPSSAASAADVSGGD